jgi:catecholate siderophore receptor
MSVTKFPGWQLSPAILTILSGLASSVAIAADAEPPAQQLDPIQVIDFRGTQMDSPKYSRELLDTPRIITILTDDLLQEQGATSLKDALKNVPGVVLQAGEGNPPSGDQLKIRGFNAREDINVNGARDLGNYFRDPFYIDQLEVVKGPNSTYSGRGSAGGTVNFVTKKPFDRDFNRLELSAGTDSFYRGTVDMNKTFGDNSALRVNLLLHDADIPGRDLAEESRHGLYAAYTWGLRGATRITADYLHLRTDDRPDAGLPPDRGNLLGQGGAVPAGLDYSNFYGHTNDFKKVAVDQFGLAIQHAFAGGTVIKNQTRVSRVHNDGWVSSPRIFVGAIGTQLTDGLVTECTVANPCVRGDTKPRDQVDLGFNNQTDLLLNFATGGIAHDLVLGVQVGRNSYENDRRRDTRGPLTSLYNPSVRTLGPNTLIGGNLYGLPAYDGSTYELETRELGIYALDTLKLSEQWEVTGGLRWDKVEATATRRGFTGALATNNTTHERDDDELSYSLGLVHKLTPATSLYAATGKAYVFSANFDRNNVQLAGGGATEAIVGVGFDTPPENITAYEVGAKWRLGTGLDAGLALFRTETREGRFPGQEAGQLATPNGEYYVNGLELLAAGKITERWQFYGGYTYFESKVTASPASGANESYVVGQQLGGTPRHAFNFFTTYDLTAALTLGGGLQYVGKVTSGVDPAPTGNLKVTVPSYTVVDLYAAYRFTPKTQLRLNVNNVLDKEYISQLAEGGGQAIPGRARQAVLTLRHDF